MILSQLEEAGAPDFILSCRAREWQARNAASLRQIYSVEPLVFSLEPLMRPEASIFLARQYAKTDPERVLTHLDDYGLSELYNNPLTLGLMGRVAEHDERLPSTRAALFDRVCKLVWPEHDEDRQDSGLSELMEDQALSAAGAIATSASVAPPRFTVPSALFRVRIGNPPFRTIVMRTSSTSSFQRDCGTCSTYCANFAPASMPNLPRPHTISPT
ncbi:hypothetical protein [Paraburkholderia sp. MM6662-R1]|uniref:hypothetical protein n=1 Tax=Paraburkholderia sp. MM6662-R1 TaxID=2991066 RepID=UPI003D1FA510